MTRKAFTYLGCIATPETLDEEILIACNNDVNRYRRHIWRITFPDQTWLRAGTKATVRRCVHLYGRNHGVITS